MLIAASAGDPVHPKDIDATPTDSRLRMQVWKWLDQFQQSDSRLVLDLAGEIYNEYNNKLLVVADDIGRQEDCMVLECRGSFLDPTLAFVN